MNVKDRFLKYVSVWTTSDEDSQTVPSSANQFDLARLLEEEMKEIGVTEVYMDEHAYVYGVIPASPGMEEIPAIAFISHMDTSPECPGKDVKPQIITDYNGGDITLGDSGRSISPTEFPHLKQWIGRTVITADGTTLLGADDKAGIAEIMTAAEEILAEDIPHGKICLAFTIDEEIGNGAELLDLDRLGADVGFTLDGCLEGEIQFENFNACSVFITVTGRNIHPGDAKDRMINSQNLAIRIHNSLPADQRPEHTEGYEGFYHLIEITGDVSETKMHYLIRDFDGESYCQKKDYIREVCDQIKREYESLGTVVTCEIHETYQNMRSEIEPCMWMIDLAGKACEDVGLTPTVIPIRGGTDGARLSFRGLPCPNLGTGGMAYHGYYEHISVEGMEKTVSVIKKMIGSLV